VPEKNAAARTTAFPGEVKTKSQTNALQNRQRREPNRVQSQFFSSLARSVSEYSEIVFQKYDGLCATWNHATTYSTKSDYSDTLLEEAISTTRAYLDWRTEQDLDG
jgi:hypothetical protein